MQGNCREVFGYQTTLANIFKSASKALLYRDERSKPFWFALLRGLGSDVLIGLHEVYIKSSFPKNLGTKSLVRALLQGSAKRELSCVLSSSNLCY